LQRTIALREGHYRMGLGFAAERYQIRPIEVIVRVQ